MLEENHNKPVRVAILLPKKIYDIINNHYKEGLYTHRSEFIRDVMREFIKKDKAIKNVSTGNKVCNILCSYNPNEINIDNIIKYYMDIIVYATPVSMDENEIIKNLTVKGDGKRILELYNKLSSSKGVKLVNLDILLKLENCNSESENSEL